MEYTKVGDYQLPNIKLQEQEGELRRYGRLRKKFLREHKHPTFTVMLLNETLWPHLMEIQQQAEERLDLLMEQMAKEQGVTEELKASDQMLWVQKMNNIKAAAEEVVLAEIVYS